MEAAAEATAGAAGHDPLAGERAAWEARGRALGSVKEHLVDLTVDVVLAVRAQYLAAGANAIKHWDQITDRMRAATRTSAGPEAWLTKLSRDLKLSAPSRAAAEAAEALAEYVRRGGERGARAWLQLAEDESTFIIARARRLAEARSEARESARAAGAGAAGTATTTDAASASGAREGD